ncbi:hypothetical protein [Nocardia sp. alder85J]|uniref:hypothetical protein n=1 Tax=Nocardia sp. alder85J TaxID=2862949 RepID=UPI001CD57832|nr:hypothetical protein [Nocardia sp. alder85J]MCX4091488.1 hypothetical protein [Nocardia sp. alder85J]
MTAAAAADAAAWHPLTRASDVVNVTTAVVACVVIPIVVVGLSEIDIQLRITCQYKTDGDAWYRQDAAARSGRRTTRVRPCVPVWWCWSIPGRGLAPDDVDAACELVTEHMRRLSTLSQRQRYPVIG